MFLLNIRIQLLLFFIFISTLFTNGQGYRVIEPTDVHVNDNKTTVLLFPANIKGIDRGSDQLLSKMVGGIDNILKIKASDRFFHPTNLNVFTSDGNIYTFKVFYDSSLLQQTLDFSPYINLGKNISLSKFRLNRLNDYQVTGITDAVEKRRGFLNHPRSNVYMGVSLRMTGIFLSEGVLFFRVNVKNSSTIPYDLDFMRFYIRDRKKSKRTTIMETEVHPIYGIHSEGISLLPDSSSTIVLAFDKFTISDNKKFVLEAFEHAGDRHLSLEIKGKFLLKAKHITY